MLLALTTGGAVGRASVVPVTVSGSLSGSLSLASTLTVTGVFSAVVAELSTATGWLLVVSPTEARRVVGLEADTHGRA